MVENTAKVAERYDVSAEKKGSFWRGAKVQARCVEALMVRDLMMRYGRGNVGFIWVLLEPMILAVGVMVIWSLAKAEKEHGVKVISLVLTGYLPLTLWRHMSNAGIFAIRRNVGLLFHRHLTVWDGLFARMLLEFAGATGALVIIGTVTYTMGLLDPITDMSLVLLGWLLMAFFSLGTALIICGLTEYSEVWERFVQPYQYLMLPLSGVFFMVDWLPPYARELILYNPSVHCYEVFRAGFYGDTVKTYYDPAYVIICSVFMLAGGLWMLDKARDRVHFR